MKRAMVASVARAWTLLRCPGRLPSANVSMAHIILEAELLTAVIARGKVELGFPLPPFPR